VCLCVFVCGCEWVFVRESERERTSVPAWVRWCVCAFEVCEVFCSVYVLVFRSVRVRNDVWVCARE